MNNGYNPLYKGDKPGINDIQCYSYSDENRNKIKSYLLSVFSNKSNDERSYTFNVTIKGVSVQVKIHYNTQNEKYKIVVGDDLANLFIDHTTYDFLKTKNVSELDGFCHIMGESTQTVCDVAFCYELSTLKGTEDFKGSDVLILVIRLAFMLCAPYISLIDDSYISGKPQEESDAIFYAKGRTWYERYGFIPIKFIPGIVLTDPNSHIDEIKTALDEYLSLKRSYLSNTLLSVPEAPIVHSIAKLCGILSKKIEGHVCKEPYKISLEDFQDIKSGVWIMFNPIGAPQIISTQYPYDVVRSNVITRNEKGIPSLGGSLLIRSVLKEINRHTK